MFLQLTETVKWSWLFNGHSMVPLVVTGAFLITVLKLCGENFPHNKCVSNHLFFSFQTCSAVIQGMCRTLCALLSQEHSAVETRLPTHVTLITNYRELPD